jgi:hypothetical protein
LNDIQKIELYIHKHTHYILHITYYILHITYYKLQITHCYSKNGKRSEEKSMVHKKKENEKKILYNKYILIKEVVI